MAESGLSADNGDVGSESVDLPITEVHRQGVAMRRRDKSTAGAVLGLAMIGATAGVGLGPLDAVADPMAGGASPAAAEAPVELDLETLEDFTGGAYMPNWQRTLQDSFRRGTFITSSYSMPIANAFAICFMCADNAGAVAIANAVGSGVADAASIASGSGNASTRADAVGMPIAFALPPQFADLGGPWSDAFAGRPDPAAVQRNIDSRGAAQ